VGCRELCKCLAFIWVLFDSSFCYVKIEELTRLDSESAFFWVESYVVFPGLLEHPLGMGGMINLLLGFYSHVIYVDLKNVAQKFLAIDFIIIRRLVASCIS